MCEIQPCITASSPLGQLPWHSTPAQAEVFRNLLTTDHMFASRCGDNHEGAPIHGRHRHGQWGNPASCGSGSRVQEKRFSQVVALDDGRYLRDEDDDLLSLANMLHCSCQGVFKQALETNPRAAVTAGTILESAHLWVLACRSCKFSGLDFEGLLVRFQCQKTSSPATSFRRTARCWTLPKSQRCRMPLSITPRGTIRVPIFSSRMTLVLCTWLAWVALATCWRRWTRCRKWVMFSSSKVCVRTCKWVN